MRIKTIVLSSLTVLTLGAVALAGPRGAHSFEKLDGNGDGKVTPAEMKRVAVERIVAADTDGDNAATPAEMKAHRQAMRSERQAKRFASKDKNGDGALTPDELSRMPESVFQKLDTDDSGSLSAEELAAKRSKRHRGKRGKGEAKRRGGAGKMLSKMDSNGDGKVDTLEAEAMASKRFARLDQNSDGVLTPDEMKRRRGRKGRGRRGHGGNGAGANQ